MSVRSYGVLAHGDKRSSRGPMLCKLSHSVIKSEKDTLVIIHAISNITNVSQLRTLDADN